MKKNNCKKPKVREVFAEDWEEYKGTKFTIYDGNRKRFYLGVAVVFVFMVFLIVVLLVSKPKATEVYRPDSTIPTFVEVEEYKKPFRVPVRPSLSLPEVTGEKKTYMDFRKITRANSAQLLLQSHAYTDEQGFRRVSDYYLVAMGTFYVREIGDTFEVSFAGGQSVKVMAGDVKADCHTDSTNRYHLYDKSVVEFIIDKSVMDEKVIQSGDCSLLIGKGAVIEIRRIYE